MCASKIILDTLDFVRQGEEVLGLNSGSECGLYQALYQ